MNRKKLKANSDLGVGVSFFKEFLPNSKILVLHEFMDGIKGNMGGFKINDFFDAIIAENLEAAASVDNPDFILYKESSPYKDNKLYLDQFMSYPNSIICTNYNAIKQFKKLGKSLDFYNINYLPGDIGPSKVISNVRNVECGLCPEMTGIHLALILGSTQIFYTGAEGSKKIDYEFLVNHVEKKNAAVPANIVKPGRAPVLMKL